MKNRPCPPAGLGPAGAALWTRIICDLADDWQLDERELHLLESACHVRDQITVLDEQVEVDGPVVKGSRGNPVVHPAVQEARQLRLAELRLLRALELEDPGEETPTTRKARAAAHARWHAPRPWKEQKTHGSQDRETAA